MLTSRQRWSGDDSRRSDLLHSISRSRCRNDDLALVRNYFRCIMVVDVVGTSRLRRASYDLEGMNVGTVAAGRIGTAVLRVSSHSSQAALHRPHGCGGDEKELDLSFTDH